MDVASGVGEDSGVGEAVGVAVALGESSPEQAESRRTNKSAAMIRPMLSASREEPGVTSGPPPNLKASLPATALQENAADQPAIASWASSAAICSASALRPPSPCASGSPSTITRTTKCFACDGPSSVRSS